MVLVFWFGFGSGFGFSFGWLLLLGSFRLGVFFWAGLEVHSDPKIMTCLIRQRGFCVRCYWLSSA